MLDIDFDFLCIHSDQMKRKIIKIFFCILIGQNFLHFMRDQLLVPLLLIINKYILIFIVHFES